MVFLVEISFFQEQHYLVLYPIGRVENEPVEIEKILKIVPREGLVGPKESLEIRIGVVYGIHGIVLVLQSLCLRCEMNFLGAIQFLYQHSVCFLPIMHNQGSRLYVPQKRIAYPLGAGLYFFRCENTVLPLVSSAINMHIYLTESPLGLFLLSFIILSSLTTCIYVSSMYTRLEMTVKS